MQKKKGEHCIYIFNLHHGTLCISPVNAALPQNRTPPNATLPAFIPRHQNHQNEKEMKRRGQTTKPIFIFSCVSCFTMTLMLQFCAKLHAGMKTLNIVVVLQGDRKHWNH